MSELPMLDLMIFLPLMGAVTPGLPSDATTSPVFAGEHSSSRSCTFAALAGRAVRASMARPPASSSAPTSSWIPEWGIGYITGIDGISLWMVLLTTFLMPLGVLASWSITTRVKPYFIFLLVLETGMLGVFCALDLFLFYLFWEVTLDPDVLPDRDVGLRPPHLRRDEVLPLHAGRFSVDARGDPVPLLRGDGCADVRLPRAARYSRWHLEHAAAACSSASSHPSPSRCPSYRCIRGCRTRTRKRRPPAR